LFNRTPEPLRAIARAQSQVINGLRQKTSIECRYLRLDAWGRRQHGRLLARDGLRDLCNATLFFPLRSVLAFRLGDELSRLFARLVRPIGKSGKAPGLGRQANASTVLTDTLSPLPKTRRRLFADFGRSLCTTKIISSPRTTSSGIRRERKTRR